MFCNWQGVFRNNSGLVADYLSESVKRFRIKIVCAFTLCVNNVKWQQEWYALDTAVYHLPTLSYNPAYKREN